MAASDNLSGQFQQLPMFVQAKHLVDQSVGKVNFYDDSGPPDKAWDKKLRESTQPTNHPGRVGDGSIAQDIAAQGIKNPVRLYGGPEKVSETHTLPTGMIMDGHHRAISAHHADPNTEVPVMWRGEPRGGNIHPTKDQLHFKQQW